VSSNWRKRLNEVYSKHTGKMTKFNYMWMFQNCPNTAKKSYAHLQCVHITTVQSLKNVNPKVWEQLITQSRYRLFTTCWKNY
jgi:hypothetical protein